LLSLILLSIFFFFCLFLVETIGQYNETESHINITEIEEVIEKKTVTTHGVAPTSKTTGTTA